MDDMTAFERQVVGRIQQHAGPIRPVDDAVIFTAITTPSPKWRFQSMFSATKFVVAGAIVALFGGFLLSGVLTQQPSDERLPAVGASAAVQAEPSDATTDEPEPTTEVEADSTTTTSDLLPGVDLVTEEVEPGVYRVLRDGARDLSKRVRDVTVTPEGDVWVETGTPKNWDIVRLGEPGVSRELGGKTPWRLFTLDGAPVVSGRPGWRLFDGEAWVNYEPLPCDDVELGYPSGGVVADGECWRTAGHLYRLDDDGTAHYLEYEENLDMEEIGLGPDHIIAAATVTEDGTLWATVHSSDTRQFEGLVRYDGSTWEQVPYDPSADSPVDGLSWYGDSNVVVGPDGTVWVTDIYSQSPPAAPLSLALLLRSWDGDAWTTYGPVEATGIDLSLLQVATNSHFFDDGTVWLHDGLLVLDADGLRLLELPGGGDLVFGPDGSAWSFAEGGLYVITPEAVTATK